MNPSQTRSPRVAITGGSGFVGSHAARAAIAMGYEVVLVARRGRSALAPDDPNIRWAPSAIDDRARLREAFAGCDAVIHCAGINRERGAQTYQRVHVQGTAAVVDAARDADVRHVAFVSFLRARPACGSPYHESKWAAEEIVTQSGLQYTILKPGVIYGRGDHMLDHLSMAFHTFPVFPLVGLRQHRRMRPLAVADVARILALSRSDSRLANRTMPVMGPEELTLSAALRRVAAVVGRRPVFIPAPVVAHRFVAWWFERTMTVPLVSAAQVLSLTEGLTEPVLAPDTLPDDLMPATPFSEESIRNGLPEPRRFNRGDLLLFSRSATQRRG